MTADEARSITRKAVKLAADAALVEAVLDRWFSEVRQAAMKGLDFIQYAASNGPAMDEAVRQMREAGFTIGTYSPGPGGTWLIETNW